MLKNKKIVKNKFIGQKAISHFRSGFFWDCKKEDIKVDSDFDFVIERVLSRSHDLKKDIQKLEEIYSSRLIKKIAKNNNGQIFGNEQIEEIAEHYNLKPKHFERYFALD